MLIHTKDDMLDYINGKYIMTKSKDLSQFMTI